MCLSATKDFFRIPPWPIFSPLHALSDSVSYFSSTLTISVISCPGLPSRDISLTTSSSHHYDRWMEIVWLRDPNSITAPHYQTFANFLRSMDSLFGTVFIFCYGLDLLVVVSLFLSDFSPFLFILCCVYLCSPLFIT